MLLQNFYQLITSELTNFLQENAGDVKTQTHKNQDFNKGYALLIWFLRFYGQKDLYMSYITDGTDDNSCDIIFSNKNADDEDIFYIVQSKNINFDLKKGIKQYPLIDKTEFGHALNDFRVVLNGRRVLGKNQQFNRKYEELRKHLENNGKAKFIFFTLAKFNAEVSEAVETFNKEYAPNVSLEVIDIERIRQDYIEIKYKEVMSLNPLEYIHDAEHSAITLPIERLKNTKRDIFEFEGRAQSYLILLKPKTIHELFKRFKFSLFFKNVRNPIHRSNYNPKIVETLLKKPDAFWYFNNGLTGITSILPDLGIHAKKMDLEGLQIINGAQTVYSVYSAYESASPAQRKAMDNYARISLRLIGSSDEDFNLQITRYTNMQNPMEDRDFWANDEIQKRLQKESFATEFWYEKRRGEFRLVEEETKKLGIDIISNKHFVVSYVAYQLQKPAYAINRQNDFFISRKDSPTGLYEEIFNEESKFIDMYVSHSIAYRLLMLYLNIEGGEKITATAEDVEVIMPSIALTKIIAQKYYALVYPTKEGKEINISLYISNLRDENKIKERNEFEKIILYTDEYIRKKLLEAGEDKAQERFTRLLTTSTFYDSLVEEIEEKGIDVEAIQAIDIEKTT
jgi:hypothetical protein